MIKRKPDLCIGGEDSPYLKRWWLIPRNRFFNVYLHQFLKDDDDRALHDHPWWSVSFLLKGRLREITKKGVKRPIRFLPKFRSAKYAHRLELESKEAWTIFITGWKSRKWGFHCPNGWVPYHKMTTKDGKNIGSCEDFV